MTRPPRPLAGRASAAAALAAQTRLALTLAAVSAKPRLRRLAESATLDARFGEALIAGSPTAIVQPAGGASRSPVVFCNGITPWGRGHPLIGRLAYALARTGHRVLIPDLPGLNSGEIGDATVDSLTTLAVGEAGDAGFVGLVGVSTGATLALLAAQRPALAGRVSLVAGIAPYADLATVVEIAATGHYRPGGRLEPFPTPPLLLAAVARSLMAGLPAGADRKQLASALPALHGGTADPLAGWRELSPAALQPAARAVHALLLNPDPARFPALYADLPEFVRAGIDRLSPLAGAAHLRCPVELAAPPRDKYFPLSESQVLRRAAAHVRLTVTPALDHAIPDLSPTSLRELARLDALGVRVLRGLDARSVREHEEPGDAQPEHHNGQD